MVATACNGVAEIISLDSNGLRAKVSIVATKRTNRSEFVHSLIERRVRRKKMKRILLLMVAATFLFSVSFALGQNIPMTFNGSYQGGNALGAGAGFYDGTINGVNVGPGQASPGMICDDYYDHIGPPNSWLATGYQVSTLNAGNLAADTLFGVAGGWGTVGLTALQGYEALAYLANDMFTNGVGNQALQSSISQAMWYLTSNAVTSGSGIGLGSLDTQAKNLVAYVQNVSHLSALSTYTGLWLYTQPFAPPGVQEMWGQIPVPEGGAALMYLLLAGVTCFGAMFYSRRQSAMGA